MVAFWHALSSMKARPERCRSRPQAVAVEKCAKDT
jgi:hypothetical protein